MALDARNFSVTGQWAKNADTVIPPIPITGRTYRNPDMTRETAEAGTPYDTVWESSSNNQKDYEVSGIAAQSSKYGIPIWTPLEDYVVGSIQLGTDGVPYRCQKAHGPNTIDPGNASNMIGPKDPTDSANIGIGSYWITLAAYLLTGGAFGEVEPIPDTLVLRNPDAVAKGADAKRGKELVNWDTMVQYVHANAGVGNVKQPEIITPEEGAIQQSLSFPIEISPMELIGGGAPDPLYTRFRVLSEDGVTIYSTAEVPYTTTPQVSVPEDVIGKNVQIRVQYDSIGNGTSAWSAGRIVRIASVVARPVPVVTPQRGSTNVIPRDVTIAIGPGAWSDGSVFTGTQSRIELFDESSGLSIYDSGWVAYATEFALPNGLLSTAKGYWIRAQHRASAAPTSNPQAVLTTPITYRDDLASSYFYTIPPTAPGTGNLQHTIPSAMLQGTQKTFIITGAISLDGGDVRYRLVNMTGGISFSKYEDIADGESVEIFVPTIPAEAMTASVQIVAYSSSGASAAPVVANGIILGKSRWVFTESAVWRLPARGRWKIKVGGAGAGAIGTGLLSDMYNFSIGHGGPGGGFAESDLPLEVQDYNVIVGKGGLGTFTYGSVYTTSQGGTSSFHGLVVATGGINKKERNAQDVMIDFSSPGIGITGVTLLRGGDSARPETGGVGNVACIAGGGGAGDQQDGENGSYTQNTFYNTSQASIPANPPQAKGGGGDTGEDGQGGADGTGVGGEAGTAGGGGGCRDGYNARSVSLFGSGGHGSIIVEFLGSI